MRRSATVLAAFSALAAAAAVMPLAATPAAAETLTADAARSFVAGRTFSYKCYEGSVGSGRIQADGSVAGTIQLRGQGNQRFVTLPPGTLMAKGESVCAKLKGVAFQPCFAVEKTSDTSFRGNLAGFDKMWCEFERGGSGRNKLAARKVKGETTTAQVETPN